MGRLARQTGTLVIAVAAVLAVAGVGSAAASRLCQVEGVGATCPAGKIYPKGTTVKALQSFTSVFSFGLTDECESGTFKGETIGVGGSGTEARVPGLLSEVKFSGCTCETTKALEPPFEIYFAGGGNKDGAMDFLVELEFVCGGVRCVYWEHFLWQIKGANLATATLSEEMEKREGPFLCTAKGKWTGGFEFVLPMPMFLTKS